MLALLAPVGAAFLPLRLPGAKQNVALYTSEVCVQHDPGPQHPECPARLARLRQAMRDDWLPEFGEHILVCEPDADVTRDQLLRVHTRKHVNRVQGAFSCARLVGRLPTLLGLACLSPVGPAVRRLISCTCLQ